MEASRACVSPRHRRLSRYRSEHPDLCRLGRARPDSHQQAVKFRYEQRRACAGHRGDARGPPIGRALRFENVDETRPATDVNAATFRIDEEVIGVTTGLGSRDELAACHGEDAKLGGRPKDDQNLASPWIQGHREVRTVIGNWPLTALFFRGAVNNSNTVGVGHIDENLTGVVIYLEVFGMRLYWDVADFATGRR